jgi:nucleotide-binding universal stress UspA family protein
MPEIDTTQPRKDKHSQTDGGALTPRTGVFTKILCAVDGTRWSTAAVGVAASLAGPDGHLTLLAVTAASGSGPNAMAAISPYRARQILSRAKSIADNAGVPSTTVVDPGHPPVDVILERARGHDLLAIGAPPTSWLGGILMAGVSLSFGGMIAGGVAAPALSRFTTPMLVVRRTSAGALRGREILVASDGEEGSDRLVELAGRLAQSQGARVTLVSALVGESKTKPRIVQRQTRDLELALPGACAAVIEPGRAADVILHAAKTTKAAMIVMGSRRLGGLRALGSVSRRIAHDAPCSVLLLAPEH